MSVKEGRKLKKKKKETTLSCHDKILTFKLCNVPVTLMNEAGNL